MYSKMIMLWTIPSVAMRTDISYFVEGYADIKDFLKTNIPVKLSIGSLKGIKQLFLPIGVRGL